MKTLLVYPNMPLQFSLPHSIGRVSSALKESGDDVRLFDTTMYLSDGQTDEEKRIARGQIQSYEVRGLKDTDMFEDFNKTIDEFNPDRMMITFVDNTVDIGMKLLKSNKKKIYTVAGGVSVILGAERFKSPLINKLCTGSVEQMLFPNNPNIELMDDWTVFDPERLSRPMSGKYYKTIPLLTDNSCPYTCGFCSAPSLKKIMGYKRKSLESVIKELNFQVKTHNPKFIYFSSETFFSMPINDFRKFAETYKKVGLPFWCQTHVNTINEERVELLREMNCHRVAVGIECGNEQYRRGMIGKKFTNEKAVKVFRLLSKYGIQASSNNIVGLPMETKELMDDTVELNRKIYNEMSDVQLNCYVYQPYHGTRLRSYCKNKGLLRKVEPNSVLGDPVIDNPSVKDSTIMDYCNNFDKLVKGSGDNG